MVAAAFAAGWARAAFVATAAAFAAGRTAAAFTAG
jgi:hypothetical protein